MRKPRLYRDLSSRPSSSGQDGALSRRKPGFDSPWAYHLTLCIIWIFGGSMWRRLPTSDPIDRGIALGRGESSRFRRAASSHSVCFIWPRSVDQAADDTSQWWVRYNLTAVYAHVVSNEGKLPEAGRFDQRRNGSALGAFGRAIVFIRRQFLGLRRGLWLLRA